MKTKTITKTFYISDNFLNEIRTNETQMFTYFGDGFKAKTNTIQISWQEPEREVTITESEFDRIIDEYPLDTNELNSLREKLFGENNENSK